jgi:hypothetical protein
MNLTTFHPKKLFFFSLLSFADLFFTYQLLHKDGTSVYESNPIANAWLSSYGWIGLGVFKMIAMTVLVSVAMLLSLRRPRLAGEVLNFACFAVGAVVIYSCALLGGFIDRGERHWNGNVGPSLAFRQDDSDMAQVFRVQMMMKKNRRGGYHNEAKPRPAPGSETAKPASTEPARLQPASGAPGIKVVAN